ncbi:MAG: hypothetical protein M3O71_02550 [Bacteroidota bacterium]|nr:hypothetical protein [Bacteroidota bacterium]
MTARNILKEWFSSLKKPTQGQFGEWIDSYWHKSDVIGIADIQNLPSALGGKASAADMAAKADKDYVDTQDNEEATLRQAADNDLQAQVNDKVSIEAGKSLVLDTEIEKLSTLSNYFDGTYVSLVALQAAFPTSLEGHEAIVDPGAGTDAIRYIYDLQDGWIAGGGSGASTFSDLTGSPGDNAALAAALAAKEPTITAGSSAQYIKGNKSLGTFLTDVMACLLTGIGFTSPTAITAADSLISALGKLQAQISAIPSAVKALYTDINTGTDDVKFATSLGLANSKYVDQSGAKLSATTSGTNTYTAIITPAITAYLNTQSFLITFPNANTGTATLNLNSIGAKPIVKNSTVALSANDIVAGGCYLVAYDGTNFQIVGNQSGVLPTVTTGEKIISVTSAGAQKNYDAVEQTISAAPLTAADFSTGVAAVTGVEGQQAYDDNYVYYCIGTNQWRRQALNGELIDLYLHTIDDTSGDWSSSDLQTEFPASLAGQKTLGVNNVYEKVTPTIWIKTSIAIA